MLQVIIIIIIPLSLYFLIEVIVHIFPVISHPSPKAVPPSEHNKITSTSAGYFIIRLEEAGDSNRAEASLEPLQQRRRKGERRTACRGQVGR